MTNTYHIVNAHVFWAAPGFLNSGPVLPSHHIAHQLGNRDGERGEASGLLKPGETEGHAGKYVEREGSREGRRSAETLEGLETPVRV